MAGSAEVRLDAVGVRGGHVGFEANSATLLDLHSDRDSLGDLAAQFRSLHCSAELQIAAQHSGRMSHRRDHVTDLSVTVDEFGEKVFRCTDSGGGRERSKARHNES